MNKRYFFYFSLLLSLFVTPLFAQLTEESVRLEPVWFPDNGDGTYSNPILHADYSDPDIVKVNDDFYMVSSSFNCAPGIPVLHSKDLVNWEIIGHVFNSQSPDSVYDKPGHGVGVWAPSIRYHDGVFYVYYADPDHGIYVGKATNPQGPWDHKRVYKSYGWIDPCPFWDEDGKAYLVHGYAKSRTGFKSILTLRKLSLDGETIYPEDSTMIFDGNDPAHPRETLEGPKMYKRNGYYYIFAPFGGVESGSQAVFRADDIKGPYQDSTVLEQGATDINGPHQGGWVELDSGESWFVHFQEKQPYGRIVHLQPMHWDNDWPVMGEDYDDNGIGEPVTTYTKPNVGATYPVNAPATSDKFNSTDLGLQWQWHSNYDHEWYSLTDEPGKLHLNAFALPDGYKNLWDVGTMLLQKPASLTFSATTKVEVQLNEGEYAGMVVMGESYSMLKALQTDSGIVLSYNKCSGAESGRSEVVSDVVLIEDSTFYMRLAFGISGKCSFSYSMDGEDFTLLGKSFNALEGKWIGAKIGLLCHKPNNLSSNASGYASFDWISVARLHDRLPPKATLIEPALDDVVDPARRFKLYWEANPVFTDSFFVYVGTSPESLEFKGKRTTTRYYLQGLTPGITYYWRIDTQNELGLVTGDVWSFNTEGTNGVEEKNVGILDCELFPNPMIYSAQLKFNISEAKHVQIKLLNASGKTVRLVESGWLNEGEHSVWIERGNLEAGTYLIVIDIDNNTHTKQLIVD